MKIATPCVGSSFISLPLLLSSIPFLQTVSLLLFFLPPLPLLLTLYLSYSPLPFIYSLHLLLHLLYLLYSYLLFFSPPLSLIYFSIFFNLSFISFPSIFLYLPSRSFTYLPHLLCFLLHLRHCSSLQAASMCQKCLSCTSSALSF